MHSYIQKHRQDSLDCQSDAVKTRCGWIVIHGASPNTLMFILRYMSRIHRSVFLTKGEFMHAHTNVHTDTQTHSLAKFQLA